MNMVCLRCVQIFYGLIFIAVCSFSTSDGGFVKDGEYLSSCRQSDPKISECLKKEFSSARKYLVKGVPELRIPAIEPLIITKMSLEQENDLIQYKGTFTNMKIYGLSNYKLDDLFVDLGKKKVDVNLTFPLLRVETDYDLKGRALQVASQGRGTANGTFTDITAVVHLVGRLIKRKDVKYFEVINTVVKVDAKSAAIHFNNLLNSDPALGRILNQFMSENSKQVINEVKPTVEEFTTGLLDEILQNAFRTTPWDRILPP